MIFQVFCNICALPGHLPCVHQTNDFRQRKLVIETFGWLAFKDWFREPEFWSWWNCSGFTNVPLYKLMQHRPHVASPTELQEITEWHIYLINYWNIAICTLSRLWLALIRNSVLLLLLCHKGALKNHSKTAMQCLNWLP